MQNGIEFLEHVVKQSNALAVYFTTDPNLQQLARQSDPLSCENFYKLHAVLHNFKGNSMYFEYQYSNKLMMYLLTNKLVFLPGGKVDTAEKMYPAFFEYEGMSQKEWINSMETHFHFWPVQAASLNNHSKENYLTYNVPENNSVRFCVLIPEQELIEHFSPYDNTDQFLIRIVSNQNGGSLYENTNHNSWENVRLFQKDSSLLNISVMLGASPHIYEESISGLKHGLFILSIFSILTAVLIQVILLLRNSKPLLNLKKHLTANEYNKDDSLDVISSAIFSLSSLKEQKEQLSLQNVVGKKSLQKLELKSLILT